MHSTIGDNQRTKWAKFKSYYQRVPDVIILTKKKPRLRLPCAAVALQQEFVVVLLLSVSFNVFLAKHGGGGRETNDNSSHDREKTGDEYSYVE